MIYFNSQCQGFNADNDQTAFLFMIYCKTGGVITGFAMEQNFPKVTKKQNLSAAPKQANFANILQLIAKKWEFLPSNFSSKTDQLSCLFAMVCKTWRWYYQFGLGA